MEIHIILLFILPIPYSYVVFILYLQWMRNNMATDVIASIITAILIICAEIMTLYMLYLEFENSHILLGQILLFITPIGFYVFRHRKTFYKNKTITFK